MVLEKLAGKWMRPIHQLINRRQAATSVHVVSAMNTAQVDPERIGTNHAVAGISRLSCFDIVAFHLGQGRFATIQARMLSQGEGPHYAICQPLHGALPGGSERVETGK